METQDNEIDDTNMQVEHTSSKEAKADRRQEFFRKARERSGYERKWFLNRLHDETLLAFQTTKGLLFATMKSFGVFDFKVMKRNSEEPIDLPKLDTFLISEAKAWKFLEKNFKVHEPTRAKKLSPKPGAAYEAPIEEGLVEKAIEKKEQLAIMLLNGTIIIGVPVVESMYSILVKVPHAKGKPVMVFKHGATGVRLYKDLKPLIG